jgi:hypothetical protein
MTTRISPKTLIRQRKTRSGIPTAKSLTMLTIPLFLLAAASVIGAVIWSIAEEEKFER